MSNLKKEIEILLKSRFTVINLVSREEQRVLRVLDLVVDHAPQNARPGFITWDAADRAQERKPCRPSFETGRVKNALDMLDCVEKHAGPALFALKDFHLQMRDDAAGITVNRKLRNLAETLKSQPHRKTVLLLTPVLKVPEELKDDVYVLEVPLPTVEDLSEVMKEFTANLSDRREGERGAGSRFEPEKEEKNGSI